MALRRSAARLRTLVAELGARSAALYALGRFAERLRLPLDVRSYLLVAQPVADTPRCPARVAARFETRLIGSDDAAALAQMPASGDVLACRFGQGAQCLGLFRGTQLVGTLWFSLRAFEEDEVRVRYRVGPGAGTAWDFDVYIDPRFRMTGAFAALWDAADARLRAHGIRQSLSRISAFNTASLRSHARLGAAVLGRADFVTVAGVQIMLSSFTPRWHVARPRGRRPVLRLPAAPAGPAAGPGVLTLPGTADAPPVRTSEC